jgi:type I restriction enzyme R subunit
LKPLARLAAQLANGHAARVALGEITFESRDRNSSQTIREVRSVTNSLSVDADVDTEWRSFIESRRMEELDRIIGDENLDPVATRAYVDGAFRDGAIQQTGTEITRLLPPVSRFSPSGDHAAKKQTVIKKLSDFFERFFGLS